MSKKGKYLNTYHRDGTVTYWSIYRSKWQERASTIPDRELASMLPADRERTITHLETQYDYSMWCGSECHCSICS